MTTAEMVPTISTGQYPSRTAAFFYGEGHNSKLPLEPYCSDATRNNQPLGQGGQGFSAVLPRMVQRNNGHNAEGAQGGRTEQNDTTINRSGTGNITHTTIHASGQRGGGVGGQVGVGDVETKEHEKENNEKERSTAQSSFSLEKETEEPLPLPFLISPTRLD